MPINKNHEFEELDGVKCAVVERNVSAPRVAFLKALLEHNRFEVIVLPTPVKPASAAKPAAPASTATTEETAKAPVSPEPVEALPTPPETFTVGVSDVMFNPTNAVFGRLLKTQDGHVVTLAYWQQKDRVANDEVPYFES